MSEVEILRANIRRMLSLFSGGEKKLCRACRAEIWFIQMRSGKVAPYTADAVCHFVDCPAAASFRKKESI